MSSEMSTDEIRANIKLGVRTSGVNPRYAIIESNFSSLTGDFDDRYVALTGHVGCLNPHMFAAAPQMFEALRICAASILDKPEHRIAMNHIDAALAKARGEA